MEPVPNQEAQQESVMVADNPQQPTRNTPLLAATSPSVAGLRTIPDMKQRRLIGVSAWALALGACGFVLGFVAMIRMIGDVPVWFEPVFIASGVIGLALIIAAFVTVQYHRLPWLLLGSSTVLLLVGVVLLGSV
ncbi:MAG: hypothetical protein ACRD0P_20190 [Stackebrandtia sp.]